MGSVLAADGGLLSPSAPGGLVRVENQQWAFVPHPLPRSLDLSQDTIYLLDRASRAVAMLSGVGETLPNPHLLIEPFLRREAVLSSRIEGTQASISDLFRFEASRARPAQGDVLEVSNYIAALELGLDLLQQLPICVRLANQVHARLLQGVRGQETRLGELRDRQVWIGAPGTPIEDARYVPPPARMLPDLLADWERFVNEDLRMPPLVQCAMAHYQFEAVHPYIDGNGRIGRLLIILFLRAHGVLTTPLLYLSAHFERNRQAYYDHLLEVSASGKWEEWVRFFLEGAAQEAHDALVRSRRVRGLHDSYRKLLQERRASGNALRMVDELFINPFTTTSWAAETLGVSYPGAKSILRRLSEAGITEEVVHKRRKYFVATEILGVIEQAAATEGDPPA